MPATDAEAVDRLATVDMLVLGARLAGRENVLARGLEPTQSLVQLFRARNRLVHPKRGEPGPTSRTTSNATSRSTDLPQPCGTCSLLLTRSFFCERCVPISRSKRPASSLWEHRSVFQRHIEVTGLRISDIPREDAPPVPDLFEQITDRAVLETLFDASQTALVARRAA